MLTLIVILLVLALPYGWAHWLVVRAPADRRLALVVTPALAVGALTLIMFWLALSGVALTALNVSAVYAALMMPGLIVAMREALWSREGLQRRVRWGTTQAVSLQRAGRVLTQRAFTLHTLLMVCAGVVSAFVLFNAAYYPFAREDAVAIYHTQALALTARGALLPLTGADSLYLTYPAAMPLAYAYVYLAAGWADEYAAKLIPTVLSLFLLPAVYALTRALANRQAAALAALALALTPTVVRWSPSGYVDLPMALYYTLAVLFVVRLEQRGGSWTDALLGGVLLGLAAWTKNAALPGVGLLGVWLASRVIVRRVTLRQAGVFALACALVAAPWYVRNWLGAGFIVPPTAWIDQAERTLATLLVFVIEADNFALTGAGILAALAVTAWRLAGWWRGRGRLRWRTRLLVWLTLPYFASWWLFTSYDPRFLLLFLPLLCVLVGVTFAPLVRLPALRRRRRGLALVLAAYALAMTAYLAWISVEHKAALIRDPFMSHEAKLALVGRANRP